MPAPSYTPAAPQTLDLSRTARTGVPRVYSGAWRQQTSYSDFALAPAPGVDPSHLRPDLPDPGQVPAGYPRVDYPPTFITQPQDDAYAHELDTPGLILDYEPRAHDVGDPDAYQVAPMPGVPEPPPSSLAHLVDRGLPARMLYAPPSTRAVDERWKTERWEQGEVQTGSTTSALRGTNSLPVNNPEGFRIGWSVKRFMHRDMPHEEFTHTERILHPAGAASAVDSPAMTAAQSNRYTSPFPWRSFYGTRNLQRAIMRRQPPEAWNVDQLDDGMADVSDIAADWVIG